MKRRTIAGFAGVMIFLFGLGLGWTLSAGAQTERRPVSSSLATAQSPSTTATMNGLPVVTGTNVGIRIDNQTGDRVKGTLVVKVGGSWKEVQISGRTQ